MNTNMTTETIAKAIADRIVFGDIHRCMDCDRTVVWVEPRGWTHADPMADCFLLSPWIVQDVPVFVDIPTNHKPLVEEIEDDRRTRRYKMADADVEAFVRLVEETDPDAGVEAREYSLTELEVFVYQYASA